MLSRKDDLRSVAVVQWIRTGGYHTFRLKVSGVLLRESVIGKDFSCSQSLLVHWRTHRRLPGFPSRALELRITNQAITLFDKSTKTTSPTNQNIPALHHIRAPR